MTMHNYVRQREFGRVRLIGSNENSRIRVSTSCQTNFFPYHFLPKAKTSVGNKESGSDMLRPKLSFDDDKICTFLISIVNTCYTGEKRASFLCI